MIGAPWHVGSCRLGVDSSLFVLCEVSEEGRCDCYSWPCDGILCDGGGDIPGGKFEIQEVMRSDGTILRRVLYIRE